MRTSPPITLPMMIVVVELGEVLVELPDGTLVEVTAVGVLIEDVEDASATGSGNYYGYK